VAGEEPGVWSGRGAAGLGLTGGVDAPAFAEVLEGRHPLSGAALRRSQSSHPVAGYDLTFAAPKSVSILHLLASGEIASEVGIGHRVAVEEATAYIDRAAIGVRRSRRGQVTLLAATGPVAGRFLHRTSRALDPHLHTHLVVANVAQGVDGVWSTLDGRRVFAHAPAAQGIYHARLRLELRQRLGAAWEVRPSGLGDVVGVDAGFRHLFSQRTAAMDEYEVGRFGRVRTPDHRRGAFHATRPDKDTEHTVEALASEWRARATDLGYDPGDLCRVVGLGVREAGGPEAPAVDIDRVRSALGQAADRRSCLSHHDVVTAVAAASATGATAWTVESIATQITDASGPPLTSEPTGDRRTSPSARPAPLGLAPRWSSASVAQAVVRYPELAATVVRAEPTPAVGVSSLLEPDLTAARSMGGHRTEPRALDLGR
jgi:conjugative relaxase-like TrwC/TraI family protein